MTDFLQVNDWARFQHYKHRAPPWVKLHRDLLENPKWQGLSDAAARRYIELVLCASKSPNGVVTTNQIMLAVVLSAPRKQFLAASKELSDAGFVTLLEGFSALAPSREGGVRGGRTNAATSVVANTVAESGSARETDSATLADSALEAESALSTTSQKLGQEISEVQEDTAKQALSLDVIVQHYLAKQEFENQETALNSPPDTPGKKTKGYPGWIGMAARIWEAGAKDRINVGRLEAALSPLVAERGAAQVIPELVRYLKSADPVFASPETFAIQYEETVRS